MQALRVDFTQQNLELQGQNIEDLNVGQRVGHIRQLNVSENPIRTWAFLSQFTGLHTLFADCACATDHLFRFLPPCATVVYARFNKMNFLPVLQKEQPALQILDLSGNPMAPGMDVFNFYLLPGLRQLCFGALPRSNFNSMALLEQWIGSFAPNITHATDGRAEIGALRISALANKVMMQFQVAKTAPGATIRNCPVLIHAFNCLTGFELNYCASLQLDLAQFQRDFQLDLTQFMKFPANPQPTKMGPAVATRIQELLQLRSQQISKQNFLVICVEMQEHTALFSYDMLMGRIINFQQCVDVQKKVQIDVLKAGVANPAVGNTFDIEEQPTDILRAGSITGPLPRADYTLQLTGAGGYAQNSREITSNAPKSMYLPAQFQPRIGMMPSFLPDVAILPERPRVEDGAVVSNTSDAIGCTWFVTEHDSLEIKQEIREALRYNTKNTGFYVDAFFHAAVAMFNCYVPKMDNAHNQIFSKDNCFFVNLVLKPQEEEGVVLKINLIKLEATVPSKQFVIPVEARHRLLCAQLRYPWGYRSVLSPNFVSMPYVRPVFQMRFQNPFLQFKIDPMVEDFLIIVFKNNIEITQLENLKQFDLIELLIQQGGYNTVEEFIRKQSRPPVRLDGLYSACLVVRDFEGFQVEETIYCEDLYLRGEIDGAGEEFEEEQEIDEGQGDVDWQG